VRVQRGTLVSTVCPETNNQFVGARLYVDSRWKMSAANITGLTMVGVPVIFAARSGGMAGYHAAWQRRRRSCELVENWNLWR
jgi:hypothetical protein